MKMVIICTVFVAQQFGNCISKKMDIKIFGKKMELMSNEFDF